MADWIEAQVGGLENGAAVAGDNGGRQKLVARTLQWSFHDAGIWMKTVEVLRDWGSGDLCRRSSQLGRLGISVGGQRGRTAKCGAGPGFRVRSVRGLAAFMGIFPKLPNRDSWPVSSLICCPMTTRPMKLEAGMGWRQMNLAGASRASSFLLLPSARTEFQVGNSPELVASAHLQWDSCRLRAPPQILSSSFFFSHRAQLPTVSPSFGSQNCVTFIRQLWRPLLACPMMRSTGYFRKPRLAFLAMAV